jgi:adenine phosphoribosyltransferase
MKNAPQNLRDYIRDVADFPKRGIIFRDITPLLGDADAFAAAVDALAALLPKAEYIAAVESRGFIFGGALAARTGARFVPIRKPGKLPWRTKRADYALEYGGGELHIHIDAVPQGASVAIVDDIIATGGTLAAACELIEELGGIVAAAVCLIELAELNGRARLGKRPFAAAIKI